MPLHPLVLEDIVRRALREDLGHGRDVTTDAVVPAGTTGKASLRARRNGVAAGLDAAAAAFTDQAPGENPVARAFVERWLAPLLAAAAGEKDAPAPPAAESSLLVRP